MSNVTQTALSETVSNREGQDRASRTWPSRNPLSLLGDRAAPCQVGFEKGCSAACMTPASGVESNRIHRHKEAPLPMTEGFL